MMIFPEKDICSGACFCQPASEWNFIRPYQISKLPFAPRSATIIQIAVVAGTIPVSGSSLDEQTQPGDVSFMEGRAYEMT